MRPEAEVQTFTLKRPFVSAGVSGLLSTPAQSRQQHIGEHGDIRFFREVGNHHKLARGERALHLIGIGQANHRIGGHDPDRLDATCFDRVKHIDRLQTMLPGDPWRIPEYLHGVAVDRVIQLHMRGQHIGQAADFTAAHCVRLAGNRKWPHAGFADTTGVQGTVDDAVDLVGAGRGLIDSLKAVTTFPVSANI
jgi:hypothetical protein